MKNNHGFTLLETLIALVVLSVGMLGIASLHVESLRNGRTATLRTKAIAIATDMTEKMRANRVAALNGDYISNAAALGSNNNCADDSDGAATVDCTPALMAQHDLWLWKKTLLNAQTGLPGEPTATIISDGGIPATMTVTINWTENGRNDSVSLQVQP